MDKSHSYDLKLSQARALSSQLGMFAEENDIPKDLWDLLEDTIYAYYEVSRNRWSSFLMSSIIKIKKLWI